MDANKERAKIKEKLRIRLITEIEEMMDLNDDPGPRYAKKEIPGLSGTEAMHISFVEETSCWGNSLEHWDDKPTIDDLAPQGWPHTQDHWRQPYIKDFYNLPLDKIVLIREDVVDLYIREFGSCPFPKLP